MASGKPSCVYVVCYAAEELKEAFKYLDFLKAVPGPNPGQTGLSGNPNCIEPLSNSILTDERMFHMKDPDLPDKLRKQCLFENGALKGWIELAGPAMVREEAVKRQKKEGWKTTRPALAVTIRIWIFQAYFRSQLLGHHDYANEMYARAQEFLEWGRKQWPNASREQRGSIFETSFIRGVKRLRLESMHRSVALRGPESEFNHQDLIDFAQDLIDDVSSDPPAGGELHVGHFIAYWIYPKATALSILGWCFLEKGCSRPKSDPERAPALKTASEYYLAAADAYPEDEERHAQFLRKHLECLTALDKPLRDTLPVCKRIRVSGAEAMEIWGGGPYKDHLKKNMDEVKEFEDRWTGEIKAGRATMDTVAGIKFTEKTLPKTEKDDIPFKVSFIDEEGEGEAGPSSK
ncbi:hypothetical protein D9611_005121 [Ephemerocybe angulata]|uniref:Uncharacterized protein n=1 Tax=Ephemerocybe angulata TaxID=980116 RepID=A0A8H5C0C3_9AGAR|nr:hypothetical protein D9611_005121 [Tulosesus angulatus]